MDAHWKIRKERRGLPNKVHEEVHKYKAMVEEDFCDKCRRGLVKECVTSVEE